MTDESATNAFTDRIRGATTCDRLLLFAKILDAKIGFEMPSAIDYPELDVFLRSAPLGLYRESSERSFCREYGNVDFNFGARFYVQARHCPTSKEEFAKSRLAIKAKGFGRYEASKFDKLTFRDPRCANVRERTKEKGLSWDACRALAAEALQTNAFFRFRYEEDASSFPRVRSLVTLDSLATVWNARHPRLLSIEEGASMLPFSYALANAYLEIYYVEPLERYLAGVFFSRLANAFSFSSNGGGEQDLWDDAILHAAGAYICTDDDSIMGGRELPSNGFPPSFGTFLTDWQLLLQMKRDLHDCPEEYVDERTKRKINAILNANMLTHRYSGYLSKRWFPLGVSSSTGQQRNDREVTETIPRGLVRSSSSGKVVHFTRCSETLSLICSSLSYPPVNSATFRLSFVVTGPPVVAPISAVAFYLQKIPLEKYDEKTTAIAATSTTTAETMVSKLWYIKEVDPIGYAKRKDYRVLLFHLKLWTWHDEMLAGVSPSFVKKKALSVVTSVKVGRYLAALERDVLSRDEEMRFYRGYAKLSPSCTLMTNFRRLVGIKGSPLSRTWQVVLSQTYPRSPPAAPAKAFRRHRLLLSSLSHHR